MADKRLAAFERREFVDPTYATPDQINDQFNAQFNAHTNDALTAFVVVAGTLASFSPKVEVEARR